ncbi:vWA-like protein [Cylindrobasidium torrendii FP15055 ss-10]|uniref:VWA-like protein n=1 Tax=Cylindrobasidium torrendii FP15055 ss-10 TaxID=1314674 RepID=A0A0D7AVH8_9AGAR|nr:vWA-like protein [Cylindrobasidium torrendii FP15055 ss-10]
MCAWSPALVVARYENQVPRPVEKLEENRVKWAGNSSPRFVRVSPWSFPHTSRLASDCRMPLAAIFQPFAEPDSREEPAPIVDEVTQVEPEYFCGLDDYWASNPPIGLERPYFSNLPPASDKREPQPMRFISALGVSHDAVESGSLASACGELMNAFFGNEPSLSADNEVAIITYDTAIHFYDLDNDNVPMPVMPDIDDVFLPIHNGLLVSLANRPEALSALLRTPPTRFEANSFVKSALGSALGACRAALVIILFFRILCQGGQVILFQLTMPKIGAGALPEHPSEMELIDTSDQKTLYKARDLTWARVDEECANEGIGVDVFLMNRKYVDVGSLGTIDFPPRFDAVRDAAIFKAQLQRLFRRNVGYNCTPTVRTSKGYYGNFNQASASQLEFALLDSDKTFMPHGRASAFGLSQSARVCLLQSAILYTTVSDQRRVRVCNLALVELAMNVFNFADVETVACFALRRAILQSQKSKMQGMREDLAEQCSSIHSGYRYQPGNVSSDARNYYAHRMMSMSATAVSDSTTGQLRVPSCMKNTYQYTNAGGVYLIDNGKMCMVWVGSAVSPQILLHRPVWSQVRNIVTHRALRREYGAKLFVVRQNMDGAEIEFADMLVEDQNNGTMSYFDLNFLGLPPLANVAPENTSMSTT